MGMKDSHIRWPRILVGRLILRACHLGKVKPEVSGCDCGPARRCPFQTYCMAARLERSTGARLEKWFWRVALGAGASLALYALLTLR